VLIFLKISKSKKRAKANVLAKILDTATDKLLDNIVTELAAVQGKPSGLSG